MVRATPREPIDGAGGTGTGAGPAVDVTVGTARIAEHVASHRLPTLPPQ